MKTINKIFFASVTCSLILLLGACGKSVFDKDYPGFDGKVLMAQASEGRNIIPLTMSSKPALLGFGASFGMSAKAAPKDIPVEFELKEDWIAQYNQKNNTQYIPLPQGSYSISGLSSVIKKGQTTSEPLTITIESKKLDVKEKYMFPITLKSVGWDNVDSASTTAWFRIDEIVRPERDVTSQATLSVNIDNSGGADANEGSKKVVDNNIDTKFYTGSFAPGLWMQLAFQKEISIGAYTLTSGNDEHVRDPKSWVFQGSDNASDWTNLDVQTNIVFSDFKQTKRFETDNQQTYKYYRIVINEKSGTNTSFQLSEWRVIEYFEQ
ncbi:BT_3987 domain-containing protein [Niabella drilacis]|uniref:F5/8 type C domain-containing protein n=1 Tax=Niabella drilacis (strain DSM 25811 / CCM 8410 / CCUG 62505 / LMG 26954 / E90) TaxID=1285928 RepID=A0A1G6JKD8_NIADE|nr:DUF1735 domain-containing protein [Niabella drilacis]SDC19219.1 F5/8 type C domain-containing protein [Niabella drilacis]